MKHINGSFRLSRAFLIACLVLVNLLAHGQTVTLVQSGSAQGLNLSSVSAAFSSSNTAGNLIVAFVRMDTTTQTVTVTDSLGNSFVRAVSETQSTDGHQISIFYAKNIKAGSNTVNATFSAANAHSWLAIYEYAGLGTTVALDQTAHSTGRNKSPTTGNSATTRNARELLFAALGLPYNYSGTVTAGTGYSLQQQNTSSVRAADESQIVSATGAYAGTFSLSSNGNWSAALATFIAAPAITTASLPAGTQTAAYNSTLAAAGGTGAYSWSILTGSLPTGLSLNATTGAISGTPTTSGSSSFTVQVSDANGNSGTKALGITVNPAPAITTTALPMGRLTVAYSSTLQASGGTSPLTWSIASGSLPAGLTLDTNTGAVTGTPTAAGVSNFSASVRDANSAVATQALSITVYGPLIDSLSPSFGAVGTSVTIAGTLFGSSQGTSTVTFNGVPGTPTGWGIDTIMVPVPAGATSGPVVVTVGGVDSNGFLFTLAPQITGINPAAAAAGASVTIAGSGFGQSQGNSRVTFNGVPSTTSSWSDTSIVAAVPAAASTGNVLVTVGSASSNGIAFTVTPSISSLSPGSGTVGTVVTVLGSNFGAPGGTITFAGVNGIPTSWSSNKIVVPVPAGATTGPVVVTASGQASNGVVFAVGTGSFTGVVSSAADGTPVAGALVEALQSNTVRSSATSDGSGSYTINALAPGSYDLRVSATGYGTTLLTARSLTAGGTTTVNGSLDSAGIIAGTVTRNDGITSIAGATVTALVGNDMVGSATTDGSGNYSIPSLAGAVYQVQASASGYSAQTEASVSVTAGNTTTANFSLVGQTVISYQYDELGRLVGVMDSQQGAASYTYDAVGNITAISRISPGQISVIDFTPKRGPAGTTVTVTGTGFSDTAIQDTIAFNGSSASVSSATATQLVTTVPSGATTGPISVTSPNGSATSSISFTVTADTGAPTITGFNPNIGNVGAAVTVSGTNFASVASDKVKFNISLASATAATSTSISTSVPAGTGSGRITVATPYGKAVSSDDFFIPPSSYTPASVAFTGRTDFGTAFTGNIPTAGQIGLVVFDATAGQAVSLQITGSTLASATVSLNQPNGSTLASLNIGTGTNYLDSTILPVTGTYTVVVAGTNSSTGSLTLTLTPDVTGTITPGTPVTVTTTAIGQSARLTFSGNMGQQVSLNLSASTYTGCYAVAASVLKPDGTSLGSTSLCNTSTGFLDALTLPASGTYTVFINPQGTTVGSITLLLNSFADVSGTITPGTPITATTTTPGQNAKYTFSGTNGQQVSINLSGSTYTGCNAVVVSILKPDGTSLGSTGICNSSTGFLDSLTLPSDGVYTVLINPQGVTTGSITVLLNSFADVTGTITAGAPLTATTTTPGQNAKYTFSGTNGQQVSINLSGSTYTGCNAVVVSILKPDGSSLGSTGICNSSTGFLDSLTLPADGTYTVFVNPQGTTTGSITLLLNSYSDVTGTITPGTPITATTTSPGQNARYTFSGTTGQQVSLNLSGSTYTGCNAVVVSILKPDNSTLGSTGICNSSTGFLDSLTLPSDGTYTVLINPQGTTVGSITVLLNSFADVNGTITAGTPLTVTTTTPGQNAKYTFSGTAGQQVSVNLSNSSYTGCNAVSVSIVKPDNSSLGSTNICNSSTGFLDSLTLPTTGTYTVFVNPQGTTTGSITLLLNTFADVTGTLTLGTPATVTTDTPGQNAKYTFSGTANQRVSVNISNSTYTGCNSLTVSILKPDGSSLGSTNLCNTTSGFLNTVTLPTTDTYTVFVNPVGAGTGSVTIQVNQDSDITGTITPGGSPVTVTTTVAGQDVRLSFSGTASQRVSLLVSSVTNPSATVYLVRPDGTNQASVNISAGTGTFFMDTQTLATTGTYQLLVQHSGTNVGSETLQLYDVPPDATGTLTIGGAAVTVTTTLPGQNGSLTFSGTAGQRTSISLSAGSYSSCGLTLKNPDGSNLTTGNCAGASNFVNTVTLGTTGTYTIVINPNGTATGSVTVQLNDDSDVTGTITPGGSPVTVTTTVAGQDVRLSFSGTASQRVSLLVSSVTNPSATVYLVKPDGTNQASVGISAGTGTFFMDTQTLATTGTYQLLVQHSGTNFGSETLQLYDVPPDPTGTLTIGGAAITVTTTLPGQNGSLTFSGTAGQQVSLNLSGSTYTGCNAVVVSILKPDGTTLANTGLCNTSSGFIDSQTLPTTGTYTVFVNPQGTTTGSITVTLNGFSDITGTITPGTPVTVTTTAAGQNGRLTFSGTNGQQVSINLSGSTYTGCNAVVISILKPDNTSLGSVGICNSSTGFLDSLTLPADGTYTVLINPQGTTAGSITVLLNSFADVLGTITVGTPLTSSTDTPGQNAKYTFSGTSGQQVSINLSGSTYTGCNAVVVSILKPDNSSLGSVGICNNSSGLLDSLTLPTDGTYTVFINPQGTTTGSITLLLNSFADVTGTITPGTALSASTTTPGQNAKYTFSGTTGQQVSINLSGSTYTGCNAVVVSILKPDNSTLGSVGICNSSSGFLDSLTLPTTGTYTVLINPQGTTTGSITVLLNSFADVTGTITPGTPLAVATDTPGENAKYSFSGTSGQQASLSISGSTYVGCNAVVVSILKPDNSTLGSVGICNNSSGSLAPVSLPTTGTYTVFVNPQGTTTGGLNVTLTLQ